MLCACTSSCSAVKLAKLNTVLIAALTVVRLHYDATLAFSEAGAGLRPSSDRKLDACAQ